MISALFVLLLIISAVGGVYSLIKPVSKNNTNAIAQVLSAVVPTPSPSPTPPGYYVLPKVQRKNPYTIFLVGDSMTLALGPHGGTMWGYFNDLYKKTGIGVLIDNYAQGSTNILSINKQLNNKTTYWDSTFEPLLSRQFDLILVESFGYNPLSQLPREEGLRKQTETLDDMMKKLITTHPNSAIVFVATIAPSKTHYAEKILLNLTVADRTLQAEERIAFIKNHIAYAKAHNIPLINVYEKSLNAQGDGDLRYINPDDYIHPSAEGVNFIGQEIASFIYDNQILPR